MRYLRALLGVASVGVVSLVVSLAVSLVAPALALAAFPGANGLLAVQPRAGGGIVLVAANGTGEHRICLATPPADEAQQPETRCRTAVRPRWSPDGRSLVFGGSSIGIVYPDGSCLDCQFGAAANPAFEPGGTEVSFIKGGRVTVDGIDAVREPSPGAIAGSDAVWSAGGSLAVVRKGAVWAGRPGHLKRIGAGSAPSWSADGRQVAAVQRGWVVTIGVADRRVRRLARGSAPAFSPDGRWIAFVAPDHRLTIVRTGLRRAVPRAVGTVRAVSVDWQPQPSSATPACVAPPGSRVLASSAQAVVTGDGSPAAYGFDNAPPIAYMGCLRTDGRVRLLERFASNNVDGAYSVSTAVVAAPYAALVENYDDEHYDDHGSTLQVFDLRTGALQPKLGGEGAGCQESSGGCPLTSIPMDDIVLDSDGVTAAHGWSAVAPGTLSTRLLGLGCAPGGAACAAIDVGHAFASSDPTGGSGAWQSAPLALPAGAGPSFPLGVGCPSAGTCVVVGLSALWTWDGTGAWSGGVVPGNPALNAVTCPSISLCLATGNAGDVAVSTDPAAGASSWTVAKIAGAGILGGPACSPSGTCSVSDGQHVYTSTDPAGGASTWTLAPSAPPYLSASCPADGLCVTLMRNGQIASTPGPGTAPQAETPSASGLTSVSCPSASFCAAVGSQGSLATSSNPAGGDWSLSTIGGGQTLGSVVCPSVSDCLATDATGHVLTSSDPAGGASAWTPELVDGNPCNDTTDCSVEQIEANGGSGVQTVDIATITGTGPYLTGLTLTGDTLSWSHDGTPRTVTLTP